MFAQEHPRIISVSRLKIAGVPELAAVQVSESYILS